MNPFRDHALGGEWVDVTSRLDRVKEFSVDELQAALALTKKSTHMPLQKTVRIAIERRLRKLQKEAA